MTPLASFSTMLQAIATFLIYLVAYFGLLVFTILCFTVAELIFCRAHLFGRAVKERLIR
jgi:hypothetical protein